jgi:hypothetical protein
VFGTEIQQVYCNGFGVPPMHREAHCSMKISRNIFFRSALCVTADNVGLAASSTMPKFLHTQALLVDLQESKEGARCIMEEILFSSKASDKNITKNTKVACMHADLKSLIARILIVNCNTRGPKISLQTDQSESAFFSIAYTQNDAVRSEIPFRVRVVRPFKRSG